MGQPRHRRQDGFTVVTTQDIWKDHPEKTLGTTAEFVQKYPNTARAMTAAVIDAGRWIDGSLSNRQKTAETVADKSYVNTDKDVILARMLGRYDNGIGRTWDDPNYMKFYNDGAVNFPYLSDGMWFLTQHRRWGLLKEDVDYLEVAKKVNRIDIYKDAAAATKTNLPKEPMRSAKLIDGVTWDGKTRRSTRARSRSRSPEEPFMGAVPATVHTLKPPRVEIGATEASTLLHPAMNEASSAPEKPLYVRAKAPEWLPRVLAPAIGLALFVALWAIIAKAGGRLPTRVDLAFGGRGLRQPVLQKGAERPGHRLERADFLGRVGIGFGMAALVGIPLGFMLGRFRFLSDMAAPVISILKPVSPLAWLPIGLMVFKAANPAAIYVIFVCSLWPMIVNTPWACATSRRTTSTSRACSTCRNGPCSGRSCSRPCCRT